MHKDENKKKGKSGRKLRLKVFGLILGSDIHTNTHQIMVTFGDLTKTSIYFLEIYPEPNHNQHFPNPNNNLTLILTTDPKTSLFPIGGMQFQSCLLVNLAWYLKKWMSPSSQKNVLYLSYCSYSLTVHSDIWTELDTMGLLLHSAPESGKFICAHWKSNFKGWDLHSWLVISHVIWKPIQHATIFNSAHKLSIHFTVKFNFEMNNICIFREAVSFNESKGVIVFFCGKPYQTQLIIFYIHLAMNYGRSLFIVLVCMMLLFSYILLQSFAIFITTMYCLF